MSHKEYISGSAFTTDELPMDCIRWIPPAGGTYHVTIAVVGRRIDGPGDIAFTQLALYTSRDGVLSQVGKAPESKVTSHNQYAVDVTINNPEIVVSVSGLAGHTIQWQGEINGFQLGPF